ncbi:MAG: hypothetical protein IRZ13_03890 [Acetobacteraceae bacterium]|nr:hypothetical protein [Acetobacteraceae bacterium]
MASSVETLRPDPQAASRPPESVAATGIAVARPEDAAAPAAPRLAAFRTGRGDERLAELLAYALAVEAHEAATAKGEAPASPPTAEAIERLREQATRDLHEYSFRLVHNRIEEIRAEAVAEYLGRHPRPPGFASLVLANLLALGLAAIVAGWMHGHPEILARLLAAFGG